MKRLMTIFPFTLDLLKRRFRRSRPGSVLIMVVALLVLLALIGTAWISTVRIDRFASAQHTVNTEVDMLVEGVKELAYSQIAGGLYDGNNFRPPLTTTNAGTL